MAESTTTGVPEQAQAVKDEALSQVGDLKDTALEHASAVTDHAHDVTDEAKTAADQVKESAQHGNSAPA
jgi:hypothetical protein